MREVARTRRSWIWLAAVLVGLAVVIVAAVVLPRLGPDDPATLTVMTRNLYLGADINRSVRAGSGRSGVAALIDLGQTNHEVREIVDHTDFAVRSQLLAAEIAAAGPDVVGLQEVALWRSGPMELNQLGRLNASTVDYDFLAMLLTQLEARQASYDVVQAQDESDVEGPAFTGDPTAGTARVTRDVRLTLRDVILVRADAGITVADRGSGQYQARLDVSVGGLPYSYIRGFAWADLKIGHTRLRFVTTQLESETADLTLAQADELLAGAAADRPGLTVIACDCNSDPQRLTVDPPNTVAPAAAYARLTGSGGFTDMWRAQGAAAGPGLTFGFGEDLRDPSARLTRRIDLVLTRGLPPEQVAASRGEITGEEPADSDPGTGLWPSDHAGVVVTLALRGG
jgi:endonuclease/exonuclease/phosphatase family metal-dependent hydrolase